METNKKTSQWLTFISIVLLLAGIYGIARTTINMVAFEKYPQEGVYPALPFIQASYPVYYQREGDCLANYGIIYPMYDSMGKIVKQTEEEKAEQKRQQELQKQNCLDGVREARDKSKINDVSQSLLLLLLGAGVFATRKVFDK